MISRDYYKILGVHPEANEHEIKEAYRELVRLHHPDSGQRAKDKDLEANTELFKAITEAYATLINPEKRKLYDYEHGELNPESSIHWLKKKPAAEGMSSPPPPKYERTKGPSRSVRKNDPREENVRMVLICILGALFGIFLCAFNFCASETFELNQTNPWLLSTPSSLFDNISAVNGFTI